jgi:hypothetical protein
MRKPFANRVSVAREGRSRNRVGGSPQARAIHALFQYMSRAGSLLNGSCVEG